MMGRMLQFVRGNKVKEKMKCKCKWKIPKLKFKESDDISLVWISDNSYVDWLSFTNQKELDESIRCLFRQMKHTTFIFNREEDEEDGRMFEYIPVDVEVRIREAFEGLDGHQNTIQILFKIGKVYLK